MIKNLSACVCGHPPGMIPSLHKEAFAPHHLCFNINTGDRAKHPQGRGKGCKKEISHCCPFLSLPPYPHTPMAPFLLIYTWWGLFNLQQVTWTPLILNYKWGPGTGLHLGLCSTTMPESSHASPGTPNPLDPDFLLETFNYEVESLSKKWADLIVRSF